MPRAAAKPAAAKRGRAKKAAVEVTEQQPIDKPIHTPYEQALITLLDSAQHSFAAHSRCLSQARELHKQKPDRFRELLFHHIDRLLIVWKREACVERIIDFIGKLIVSWATDRHKPDQDDQASGDESSDNPSDDFVSQLIEYLLPRLYASDKAVRFRSCQILATALESMDPDAEIDDVLAEHLVSALIDRTSDKQPFVRAAACSALARLQMEGADLSDPICAALVNVATCDTHVEARKAAMSALDIESCADDAQTSFLARCRDVNASVRRMAFQILATKMPLRKLSVLQRQGVIIYGIQDRDPAVVQSATSMLKAWLDQCECNALVLLDALGVEFMYEPDMLLKHMFKNDLHHSKHSQNTPSPPYKAASLTAAHAIYWRCLGEYLDANQTDDANFDEFETIMTDTPILCDAITMHSRSTFIACNLLQLVVHSQIADESSRQSLQNQCVFLLCKTADDGNDEEVEDDEEVLKQCCSIIRRLQATEAECLEFMHQRVIIPLLEHREDDKWRLLRVMAEVLSHIHAPKQSFGSSDPSMDSSDLVIPMTDHPIIDQWRESIIEPFFVSSAIHDDAVRAACLRCLGLMALLSREVAERYWPALLQAAKVEAPQLQLIAIQAVVDISLLFEGMAQTSADGEERNEESDDDADGSMDEDVAQSEADKKLAAEGELGQTLLQFGSLLYDNIALQQSNDDESIHDQTMKQTFRECSAAAIEGLCKLLLHGRIRPHRHYISAMILLLFDSRVMHHTRLIQCLAVFLPAYAALHNQSTNQSDNQLIDENRGILIDGMIAACCAIAYDKESQHYPPLVTVTNYCHFAVHNQSLKQSEQSNNQTINQYAQAQLIEAWLAYLLAFPQTKLIRAVSSGLATVDVMHIDRTMARDLLLMVTELIEGSHSIDRFALKNLEKLRARFEMIDESVNQSIHNMSDDDRSIYHARKNALLDHARSLDLADQEAVQLSAKKSTKTRSRRQVVSESDESESEDEQSIELAEDNDDDQDDDNSTQLTVQYESPPKARRATIQRTTKSVAVAKIAAADSMSDDESEEESDESEDEDEEDEQTNFAKPIKQPEVQEAQHSESDEDESPVVRKRAVRRKVIESESESSYDEDSETDEDEPANSNGLREAFVSPPKAQTSKRRN